MAMIPCPDCKRHYIHSLFCPNAETLPRYATVLLIEPRDLASGALDVVLSDEGMERAQ